MKIVIAGAGSGKTTSMANKIADANNMTQPGKNVFCIAFTNNAVEHISEKLEEIYSGEIPCNVKVMTIHSFLYQEIVKPYYYLLYGVNYECVSLRMLSKNPRYHQKEVSDLEKRGALHVAAITQRAMWVVKGKSTDKKIHKDQRKRITQILSKYCGHIFVDEAQDIDDCTKEILIEMDKLGIPVTAIGDPKQDIHGFGNLRFLEEYAGSTVEYITKCYRCPQKHLLLSNTLVNPSEVQRSGIEDGNVNICFETGISNMLDFIEGAEFDLVYINKKNDRFDTHALIQDNVFEGMNHLLLEIIPKYFETSDLMLRRYSYWAAKRFVEDAKEGKDISSTVKQIFKGKIDAKEYAQIASVMNNIQPVSDMVVVNSIESIKGKEGDNCLFLISSDLATYLFLDKKEDNKTKAALYVALTRSRKDLTIMLTKEAEERYPKELVEQYFGKLYGATKAN